MRHKALTGGGGGGIVLFVILQGLYVIESPKKVDI